ncbi:pilin [Patescibacteria group bacterium]|nr:pilin [Patescibacteria group bacterium]
MIKKVSAFSLSAYLFLPMMVFASEGLVNPLKVGTIEELLALVLKAVVNIGTIVLILMLVYVGFLFVVGQGNEEKISEAKKALMWTVIGGLVLLGAQAISLVIQSTVGSLQA